MNDFYVKQDADKSNLRAHIELREPPFTVSIAKGIKRKAKQSNLVHRWFSDIAAHHGDVTKLEEKARCKWVHGRPILARENAAWLSKWLPLYDLMSYEQSLLLFEVVPVTSQMTSDQMAEFMESVRRDALSQGIHLTNPDDLKWRGKP